MKIQVKFPSFPSLLSLYAYFGIYFHTLSRFFLDPHFGRDTVNIDYVKRSIVIVCTV